MTATNALIERIASRLLRVPEDAVRASYREFGGKPVFNADRAVVHAAVLIALVRRADVYGVLYTERATDLRSHSGQVAFPGGKIDDADAGAAEAAMREAAEEVALRASDATVIGFLPNYFTGSNYRITPVVAEVQPTAPFHANPGEVAGMFEVPLAHLTPEAHYSRMTFKRGGSSRSAWRIDHDGHTIWGITANLTRLFRDIALGGAGANDG
ncbi:MAG TPA: CoA pyrophosphatase, partial [Devosiaceae bacterium]|nr:CoA pyrophosphatase [Devosiaceae bacterium]